MILDGSGPRWFSIDAHRPFLLDLARVLLTDIGGGDPAGLSHVIVLVPTRRGARALAEAFVTAANGRAVLLPQIRALGDLEEGEPPFEPGELALELPPAIAPLRRRFELARLVHDNLDDFARHGAGGVLQLADALASLIDSAAIEEAELPTDTADLVPGEFAEHWAVSEAALRIATDLWPARLAELGLVDVAARRTALLHALAAQWSAKPPDRPLIAAGSTGSAPATARLLRVIAEGPKGLVVLPGLDRELAESAWLEVGEDHPQGAMRRLLQVAGVDRDAVRSWPTAETGADAARGRARRRLIGEALRPAEATKDWLVQIDQLRREGKASGTDVIAEGLFGLSLIEARHEEDAAAAIAVLMREALETPGRTAALVTPDQALARRVSVRLGRWRIEVDNSGGRPLCELPVGSLIGLVADAAAERFSPGTLLAILKHPLVTLAESHPGALRTLERRGFRGPRPAGWDGLSKRLNRVGEARDDIDPAEIDAALVLADALRAALQPLTALFDPTTDAVSAATGLAKTVEALAGPAAWSGQAGEAASNLIAGLIDDGAALPPVTAAGFADLILDLLRSQTIRPGGALHPRLQILGAIEARLVRADLLILAGLEEGVWPRVPDTDLFFSRPMRQAIGLPPPERRIGLSAHDFAQAAAAPEVVLVTQKRRGGQPAVRSRWLWRLQTLARGAGTGLSERKDVLDWARALDAPIAPPPAELKPATRPAPTPPVDARPRKLPVTRIETWVRDPYAVYARHILGLRAIDPPDAPMDARARGTAIHRAFEHFAKAEGGDAALFERLLTEALEAEGVAPHAMARERTLARRLADWAVGFEAERRTGAKRFLIEQSGALTFDVGGRDFTVTAKADRIEIEGALAHVLDFKTGQPASKKQMERGFAPQLTLTAAILKHGGFADVGALDPGELTYVRVTGRNPPAHVKTPLALDASSAEAEKALAGLKARVLRFDDQGQAYASWAAPQYMSDRGLSDYDHLARVYEWHVAGEEAAE
jgi:ATP-dependent helicase/nuclease subunit B